jgi:hypothetical protein
MDNATFQTYVEERYNKQMLYYSNASAKNQRKYRQFQWILIILSALTPVVAALNGIKWGASENTLLNSMNILVVVISSVVAILTTGMKTFNYQELWITYRATYEKLKPEIHYYDFNVGDYGKPGTDKESLFVSRVEAILDAEHTQWPPAKKLQPTSNTTTDGTTTTTEADTPSAAPVANADNEHVDDTSGK